MRFLHLILENWRNFRRVEVPLERRMFLVGPNASGKSNFLDSMRFLRDVADPQGGFQRAIQQRGGVSQIRSLHARQYSDVIILAVIETADAQDWSYLLAFNQDNNRRPIVKTEEVYRGEVRLLHRPDKDDESDPNRLSQTALEQVNSNKEFRAVADMFAQVRYLHLVPQLVREPDRSVGRTRDPFGGDFLEQLARLQKERRKSFDSRMRRIRDALRVAVPQLRDLKLERDARGVPHLRGLYEHWRPKAGWQTEDQFSDGTLRLLGLLWALLDGSAPLLLEEPELSLHAAVVRYVPAMMARLGRKVGRQIIVSSHSAELLADESIGADEVLLLTPSREGTVVGRAADDGDVIALLEGGVSMAAAVLPRTAPSNPTQLTLFGE
jgi:predicted ATPase